MMAHKGGAAFQWAMTQDTAFLAHVVSRTGFIFFIGRWLRVGRSDSFIGDAVNWRRCWYIDAAMKSAPTFSMVTYRPPPSETNYSGRLLTGSQAACKAACNTAFTDAVLDIARSS